MVHNFSMISPLFIICYKAAHRESSDPAPKCLIFPICKVYMSLLKSIFTKQENIFLASLLLIVDLPNTRYYSVDR